MSDIIELRRSFEISLRSRNRAPGTIKSYLQALDLFREFSVTAGYPTAVGMVIREQVEAFQADQLVRWKPKTAAIRYGALLQFFKWAVREGEVSDSPMAGMGPPSLPEVSVPVVSDDDLKKLLKVCSGMSFVDRRDTAILRLFIDCGLRLSEVAMLGVEDVNWDHSTVSVVGKGARPRSVPYAAKTAQALDRYARIRKTHICASSPMFWLGGRGPFLPNGIAQMLRRRCAAAGIAQLHPHMFRHTAAHVAAREGFADSDMMRIFGWKSRQMLQRYGASAADERAQAAYRKLAPGDRL